MGVTDCHVHINPVWEMRPEARELVGHTGAGAEVERYLEAPSSFLEYLDRSGVDRAVLVNYIAPEVVGYTERANDFVANYVRVDPERLIAIGSVLPTHPAPAREVARLADELGLRGLKIHPPHQRFAPNGYVDGTAEGLREIYGAAEDRQLPVIFHTGTSIFPGARNRFADPMLVEDVAIDFPRLSIVLAHGGRPLWMSTALFLTRRFPNVYLELSSVPPARIPEYFPGLDRIADRVVFGSDWPGPGVRDIGDNLRAFQQLPISAEIRQRILERNPEQLWPRRPR